MSSGKVETKIGPASQNLSPGDAALVTPVDNIDCLTSGEIPNLIPSQLQLITQESVREQHVERFNTQEAIEALRKNEGERILTIDFGGGKATKIIWEIKNGALVPVAGSIQTITKEGDGGNYMPFFQEAAHEAQDSGLDVAISFGGPLEGTKPLAIPNATEFMTALETQYGGDFAQLFPSLKAVNNDAQAGIKAAALAAKKGSIMFPINGGGFGLALLIGDELIATEIGHAQLLAELNIHHQRLPCGMLKNEYVCIERVAASGAGIESLWHQLTGNPLDGREISRRYQAGDSTARELYENSALLITHGIVGMANIEKLMMKPDDTTIAFHGGGFRVPGLKERIMQIIGKNRGFTPPALFTDDLSINACAEGAAIAAFYNPIKTQ